MKRIIPTIVVDKGQVFHRSNFKNDIYLGDPVNLVRIFNEKNCDELTVFDTSKNIVDSLFSTKRLEKISENIFIPLNYGGSIKTTDHIDQIFQCGVEKIVFKFIHFSDLNLIEYCANKYGEQSVILNLNITSQRNFLNMKDFISYNNSIKIINDLNKIAFGELLIQRVELSGTNKGIDKSICIEARQIVSRPIIYSGGIKNYSDIKSVFDLGIDAVACSTLFTLHPKTKTPLLSYISWEDRINLNLL